MRFSVDTGPFHGEIRTVKAFAWFPVRIVKGGYGHPDEYVWLESYQKRQMFEEFGLSKSWVTIQKFFKKES